MRILSERPFDRFAGFGFVALGAKIEKDPGIEPDGHSVILVHLEELFRLPIPSHFDQMRQEQVAEALGGDARLVNEVVMFVQMNGPTQAKILEGWKA